MSSEYNIPLEKAKLVADRFLKLIESYCEKVSIAGSTRRECPVVHDIEFVVVPKDEFALGRLFIEGFPGMITDGLRLKKFNYPESNIKIELYITTISDWGRMLAIRTGSSAFSHHLAVRWTRLGWTGTEDGLRKKSECIKKSTWKIKPEYKHAPTLPPVFDTEEKFFAFLGIEYVDPVKRSWVSKNEEYNYAL